MRKMLLVMTVILYIAISAHLLWAVQKADFGGGKRYAATGFTIGSKGYIGTGSDGSKNRKDFWEYDPVANTWTQKVNLGGDARYAAVGFSVGERVNLPGADHREAVPELSGFCAQKGGLAPLVFLGLIRHHNSENPPAVFPGQNTVYQGRDRSHAFNHHKGLSPVVIFAHYFHFIPFPLVNY